MDNKYLDSLHSRATADSEELPNTHESHIRIEVNPNIYVNKIEYFPETGEFYVSVLPKEQLDVKKYYQLSLKADSLIYRDGETLRKGFPIALATEYFDLSLLDYLNIYDYSHSFITRVKFSRVEYYQSSITSSYIAVFKPEKTFAGNNREFYCVSINARISRKSKTDTITDNPLTERIKKEMGIQTKHVWAIRHVNVPASGSIISILSCDEKNKRLTSSYLTEMKNNKLTLMNFYNEEFAFLDILPLPLEINFKPVFLITLGIPGTDEGEIYAPLVYDKNVYWLIKGNKVYQ
jgi:hypothetical protein